MLSVDCQLPIPKSLRFQAPQWRTPVPTNCLHQSGSSAPTAKGPGAVWISGTNSNETKLVHLKIDTKKKHIHGNCKKNHAWQTEPATMLVLVLLLMVWTDTASILATLTWCLEGSNSSCLVSQATEWVVIRSDCQWCHQCWHHQYQCHQCHQRQLYHLTGAAGRSGLGVTSKKDIDSLIHWQPLSQLNTSSNQFPQTAVCFLPSPVDVRYRKEGFSHGLLAVLAVLAVYWKCVS